MKRFLLYIALMLGCVRALAETPAAVKVSPTDGPGTSIYGPILYDPSGNIMAIGNNSGVSSSYIYDPMGRLTVANVQRAGICNLTCMCTMSTATGRRRRRQPARLTRWWMARIG